MNKPFIIFLGFSHDQKFIVNNMENAHHKYELHMETDLAEKIAAKQLILPAEIGGHPVSIRIKLVKGELSYSAEIVPKMASDKFVFINGQILFKTGNFQEDLKKVNCNHRMVVAANLKRQAAVELNRELQAKRYAASELKHFKIKGVDTHRIAARLAEN